jgi:hypothetical protein
VQFSPVPPLSTESQSGAQSSKLCPVPLSWPVHDCAPPQAAHVTPAVPHELFVSFAYDSHDPPVPPLQHPAEHDVSSQTHFPLLSSHSSPAAHAAHIAPPVPHELFDSEAYPSHTPPAVQQPLGHDVPSHTHFPTLVLHSCPDPHEAHVAPPVPHEPFDSDAYASHVPLLPPLQQPFGHDVPSQTHCPLPVLHSRPDPHDLHDAPPEPHDEFTSLPSGTHVAPLQQPAHDPPPQLQVPLVHACPLPHSLQAAPPVPHTEVDCEA